MDSQWYLLIGLLVGMVIGAALGWLLHVVRYSRPGALETRLAREETRADILAAELERLHEEHEREEARDAASTRALLEPVNSTLAVLHQRVDSLMKEQTSANATFASQLSESMTTSREVLSTTHALRSALTSTGSRGTWGEVELERILEYAGMVKGVHYQTQTRVTSLGDDRKPGHSAVDTPVRVDKCESHLRPDVLVRLPDGAVIVIDAKAPLDSFLAAHAIPETDRAARTKRAELMAAHAKALRGHITALSGRDYSGYFPTSPQFVVLFVPSEAILAAALDVDPGLLEYAAGVGVILTSPTTLLAVLKSVGSLWSLAQVSDEAEKIRVLGRELASRLDIVVGYLNNLGKALDTASVNYNKAVRSMESRVLSTARKFNSLETPVRSTHLTADEGAGE